MTPDEYLKENEEKAMARYCELLRIPSISALEDHRPDMRRCADWLVEFFAGIGLEAELMETGGHPLVFAEYRSEENAKTILIYGHYDVQPVDPIELWKSEPFQPRISGGYIYARGAVDNKGQIFAHCLGVEAWLKTAGKLPVNVKFIIEGEEESGTSSLAPFLEKNRERFRADAAVVSDGVQFGPEMPAITIGLRGITGCEVKVTGPDRDLHSGSFGGAVDNPIHVLAGLIAGLHRKDGKIMVPCFYDRVRRPGAWEKKQLARLPFDSETFRKGAGVPALHGESRYSPLEQIWSRPTLEINGIQGGYLGEGVKTIIPSWASAKITMRLVPDQEPEEIGRLLELYLKKICPPTVKLEIQKFEGGRPYAISGDNPWLGAGMRALKSGFEIDPYFIKEGGSIPIVDLFHSLWGLETLLIGFGQSTDNAHSPNERFLIRDFKRGCRTSVALFQELATGSLTIPGNS